MNENYFQKRKCYIFDVFDVYNQRVFKTTIQQKNEINNINQRKLKNKENAKNKCNEDNCVDTQIKHNEYVVCTKKYRRNQKI